jgi:hypothetical protein
MYLGIVGQSGEKVAAGKVNYLLAKKVCEVLEDFATHIWFLSGQTNLRLQS